MYNFLCQIVPKSPFYILFTYYPNFTDPVLYHYPPNNSFTFDLANTTCINIVLWLNLNYKKLLKCVFIINFLRMNLKYKTLKMTQ